MIDAHILIATPVRDHVSMNYFHTIVGLLNKDKGTQTKFTLSTVSTSDLVAARNYYVNLFLENTELTHLFFMDSDTGFKPSLLQKMIDFDKPFVSALCPSRLFKPERAALLKNYPYEPKMSFQLMSDFICKRYLVDQTPDTINGFKETKGIGMGTTLLRRDVLETLSGLYPDLWTKPRNKNKQKLFQPFTPCMDDENVVLSEDLSFCKRWTDIGGKIWVNINETVSHTGTFEQAGNYLQNLIFLKSEHR